MAAAITRLPNELLLHIFTYLSLKSLIASYGVCRLWRQLLPAATILPNRLALFRLYLEVVSSPCFPMTRPWTLKSLEPFDREAYVSTLLEQHNYLPEAFRLWVLEWPALAVFGCVWPGLPSINIISDFADGFEKLWGCNWMCTGQVSTLWLDTDPAARIPKMEVIPALLVRSYDGRYNTWLVLDKRKGVRDKVYILEGEELWKEEVEEEDDDEESYENWIEFQRAMWKGIEKEAAAAIDEQKERKRDPPSHLLGDGSGSIPAHPWVRGQARASPRVAFKRVEQCAKEVL
jgi:hypothetical protein